MKIGIFTYGTRGDLQPYIALALGLKNKGHQVTIAATGDFKDFVEGFGLSFQSLWGNAEMMMNSAEGQRILQTGNPVQLMKYYFKVLHDNRYPLRNSYYEAVSGVDYIIANLMTLPIVSTIAEKQQKKMVLTYFMPPVVPTGEYPLPDFDFFNFPWYNRLTYKVAQWFFWKIISKDTNEYRQELGLPVLKENLVAHLDKQRMPDLYCISPALIGQPKDWQSHHKITGFIHIPAEQRSGLEWDHNPPGLEEWLRKGEKPVYMGFGSNGVGNPKHWGALLKELLQKTGERILFCTGWSQIEELEHHENLFVAKYVHHETVLPRCKLGLFHGGAGTLAALLRHDLPVIVVSFYTDQPTWGKIVERKKVGVHIPVKKLTAGKLVAAIRQVQTKEIRDNVVKLGQQIRTENGLGNAIREIEHYFSVVQ